MGEKLSNHFNESKFDSNIFDSLDSFVDNIKKDDNYNKFISSNIFIIGSVTSGKSELMENLQKHFPFSSIDIGKLFRISAYAILNDEEENKINPDITLLSSNDEEENNRVSKEIFQKTKLIKNTLNNSSFEIINNKNTFTYNNLPFSDQLESREISLLLSNVASSSVVRKSVWEWIHKHSDFKSGVILTGHNLKEIDCNKFRTVFLSVDKDEAVKRLLRRSNDYENTNIALEDINRRNNSNEIDKTYFLGKKIRNAVHIDTTKMSPSEVFIETTKSIFDVIQKEKNIEKVQKKVNLEREKFIWSDNPILSSIGEAIDKNIKYINKSNFVSDFDLKIQTLTNIARFEVEDLFKEDFSILNNINNKMKESMLFKLDNTNNNFFCINEEVVLSEINNQFNRLTNLMQNSILLKPNFPLNILCSDIAPLDIPNKITTKKKEIISQENGEIWKIVSDEGKTIIFKSVPPELSFFYGKYLHYLHSERNDELKSFGAYIEGEEYPFAWTSFSQHDRNYKLDMFNYHGIEGHNVVEMTRAWNADWSPKNTMSSLFAYSADQIIKLWNKNLSYGLVDKPLKGISTTINPNFGFKGSSFLGSNFLPIALRPAKFTYWNYSDGIRYSTRRQIQTELKKEGLDCSDITKYPFYSENKIAHLPLNEMIWLFSKDDQLKLLSYPIYKIDEEMYNKI